MVTKFAARFRDELLNWSSDNIRDFPWREEEASLYEVFIAEFFLTQTPAENVAEVYPCFIERFPSLKAIERADRETLEETIEPLGLHRIRAEALSKIAFERDTLPEDPNDLVELPRVGPYVANATVCFALDRSLPILERNVVRVYRRVFGEDFPEREQERREFAEQMLPDDGSEARKYNLALLDFGAQVCKERNPKCSVCFASDYCKYYGGETH